MQTTATVLTAQAVVEAVVTAAAVVVVAAAQGTPRLAVAEGSVATRA